jgi:hypothetical protein
MGACVHDDLDGVALLGYLPLVIPEAEQRLFELIGSAARKSGQIRVTDESLGEPAVFINPRRLDDGMPAKTAGGRPIVGEDARQLVDDAARVAEFPAAPSEFGLDDVDSTLEHAAQVRKVRLLLLGLVAELTDLRERQAAKPIEVALGEHSIDTAMAARAVGAASCVSRRIDIAVLGHLLPP